MCCCVFNSTPLTCASINPGGFNYSDDNAVCLFRLSICPANSDMAACRPPATSEAASSSSSSCQAPALAGLRLQQQQAAGTWTGHSVCRPRQVRVRE
jgi:hypothetical protein